MSYMRHEHKKNVESIVKIWTAAFRDPTPARLSAAEGLTGIRLEKNTRDSKRYGPYLRLCI